MRQSRPENAFLGEPTTPSSIRPIHAQAGRCTYGGISFEMPHQESVESILMAFRTSGGAAFPAASISVTRDLMRPNDTLRTHTDRTLSRLGREADDFDLVESRAIEVGGRPAQRLRFTWTSSELGKMDQTLVLVDPFGDPDFKVLVITAVGPLELASETIAVLEKLLTTLRFDPSRAPEPSTRPEPPRSARTPQSAFVPMPGYRNR